MGSHGVRARVRRPRPVLGRVDSLPVAVVGLVSGRPGARVGVRRLRVGQRRLCMPCVMHALAWDGKGWVVRGCFGLYKGCFSLVTFGVTSLRYFAAPLGYFTVSPPERCSRPRAVSRLAAVHTSACKAAHARTRKLQAAGLMIGGAVSVCSSVGRERETNAMPVACAWRRPRAREGGWGCGHAGFSDPASGSRHTRRT